MTQKATPVTSAICFDQAMMMDANFRAQVTAWVDTAAKMSREALGKIPVRRKSDGSAVTEIDQDIERFFQAKILQRYPSHSILGEEFGLVNRKAVDQPLWVLDPLDGTEAYSLEFPTYAISLALYLEQRCVYGCVHLPYPDKTLEYFEGDTRVNSQKLLRQDSPLKVVLAPASYHRYFEIQGSDFSVRTLGSFCFHAFHVLAGTCDAVVATKARVWDLAAIFPMLEKQGLVMTDFRGNLLNLDLNHTERGFDDPFLICQANQVKDLIEKFQPLS